jgi:hypothetical protein
LSAILLPFLSGDHLFQTILTYQTPPEVEAPEIVGAKPMPLASSAAGIGIVAGARSLRGILPSRQEKMAKIAQEIGADRN